jgi:cytochrome b involved in lipid metabolism
MKKALTITLFIFWAIVTAVLVAGLITWENNKKTQQSITSTDTFQESPNTQTQDQTSAPGADQKKSSPLTTTPAPANRIVLTATEVAKHNKQSDCWMIISNKVYDLTSAISGHPGGASTILPYCGKDGTTAFATKDLSKPKTHSSFANDSLTNYFLGNLNQSYEYY